MKAVLVFGGGGAKSLAQAGAWKAVGERGVEVTHIVATSMGAVVGAAFAAGSSYEQFVATARSLGTKDVAALDYWAVAKGMFASHLYRPEPLKRSIARLVPATEFAQLEVPLTVTTTDVESGELVLFGALGRRDVPLGEALYASCALPLYFPPARIDGRELAEGGLRAVLPLALARELPADLVVAIDVGPGFDEPPVARRAAVPALVRAHGAALRVMMAAQTERAIAAWPREASRLIVVRAVAEREATFAVAHAGRYLEAGYEATRAALRLIH